MGFYVTDWGLPGWKNGQILGRLFKVTYTGKSLAAPKPSWYIPAATGKKFKASTSRTGCGRCPIPREMRAHGRAAAPG